jgi:glycosyltransferase involved in cell wall biosynthesis
MKDTPAISVAMATYNGANFITAQLTSLVEQKFPPAEIVICDDCSTDDTVSRIKSFAEDHPHLIRFYQNPQRLGFIANFERAISFCRGDLIALSDQDDVWLPTKLEKVVLALEATPGATMAVVNAALVDSELRPLDQVLYSDEQIHVLQGESSNNTLLRGLLVFGCTLAFRADFVPFIMPIAGQEWGHDHWIATMLAVIGPVATVSEPQIYYRRHTTNTGVAPFVERNPFVRIRRTLAFKMGHISLDAYETDVRQWRELSRRIQKMGESSILRVDRNHLREAQRIVDQRASFAELRLQMRKQNPLLRLPKVSYFLVRGRYHQDANGFGAFLKDAVVI